MARWTDEIEDGSDEELPTAETTHHRVGDSISWLGQTYQVTDLHRFMATIRRDTDRGPAEFKVFISELNAS